MKQLSKHRGGTNGKLEHLLDVLTAEDIVSLMLATRKQGRMRREVTLSYIKGFDSEDCSQLELDH